MADSYQTGGEHPPKDYGTDGNVSAKDLTIANEGTNTGSPLDDKGNTSNKK